MQLPLPFEEEMIRILGEEEFHQYQDSLSEEPKRGVRANTLKIEPEQLAALFAEEGFELIPWISNGFFYQGDFQPAKHPFYHAGLYYMQDPSAMTPASRLPIEPGDLVLDVCAAPGGKSTELAAKLNGSGILFSNDVSMSRSRALLKNLELFGVKNSVILSEEPKRLAERLPEYFDKILVDAPCSGEGMFRKERKMVRAWEEHGPSYFAPIQSSILDECAKMLKPGGMLLYSTCTFSPMEDEGTVQKFLMKHPDFVPIEVTSYEGFSPGRPDLIEECPDDVVKAIRIFPHRMDGEGHFLILLQKQGDPAKKTGVKPASHRRGKLPVELLEFLDQVGFSKKEKERIYLFGQKAVLLPEHLPDLSSLRTLRTGLLLGECKKKRFEPSQALALALRDGEYPFALHLPLSDSRVIRYLKGETLELTATEEKALGKNTVLVFADCFPLGWGKSVNGILKNHYLPAWRMTS